MQHTYIIAEVAQAHEGSLGILHSYIDAVAKTGADAIKFQTHIAEAESSVHEPFRVKFSYEDATRYDYWHRMSFTAEQWKGIKAHCDEVGLDFISSPFSQAAVDLLESLDVTQYKIGSGEVTNFLMLEKICKTGKRIILSSGMSSFEELDEAVAFVKEYGNDLVVLQCTTSYPTPYERLGLNVIQELRDRYDVPVGLSEHTGKIYAGIAAAALGTDMLEFHVVFDRRMFGPDATSSLTIDETKQLVEGVRAIEAANNNPIDKADNSQYKSLKAIFEKSLAVNRDLPQGHILRFEDLEAKKPSGFGIAASKYEQVVGVKLQKAIKKWTFLSAEYLSHTNYK